MLKQWLKGHNNKESGALDVLKYIGPGLLVTVGFIDPGNWASNIAAGADFGYALLWVVTLSTIMLIMLQHNVAHLGIATGLCLSEAITKFLPRKIGTGIIASAMIASIATSFAEILGAAVALNMLFGIPVKIAVLISAITVIGLLFTNSYRKIERWIIAFVSIIGLSFIYELSLITIDWPEAITSSVRISFPEGSMIIIMSVLGAVVMPHNLFLHSEVIQSRQWNLEDEEIIKKQLKYEFLDTLLSMLVGWAINSAMIVLAAAVFFKNKMPVQELEQAQNLLTPLVGPNAAVIFAVALLFAGISSSVTSGIAGGSIFSGWFREPYDIKDSHSKTGVLVSILIASVLALFVVNPFKGLVISQMMLSIQLPITIFAQIYLTSSERVMGKYKNHTISKYMLYGLGAIVTLLNVKLLIDVIVNL